MSSQPPSSPDRAPRRSVRRIGVSLEVVAWLWMVVVAVGGVVVPLVRLGNRAYVAWRRGEGWQTDTFQAVLTDQGVAAVYGTSATPLDGSVASDGFSITAPQTTAQVTIDHPGLADVLVTTGLPVLGSLIAVAGVFFLWRTVRTVRQGNPFDPRNATRLYAAGIVFLAGALLALLLGTVLGSFVALNTNLFLSTSPGGPDFTLVFFGLVLVMLGEVFRQGTRLRRDTEGLV